MLPDRLFRRLDRSRLESRALRRAWPAVQRQLEAVWSAHSDYAAGGRLGRLPGACQGLGDLLGDALGAPPKRVLLRDRPRPHRRRAGRLVSELHGLCSVDGPIEVYTRTAVRARPVALKTMLHTFLHEWVHHWDFSRFGASVHCRGFYERVGQLYRPARAWVDARRTRVR